MFTSMTANVSAADASSSGPAWSGSMPMPRVSCSTATRAPSSPTQMLPGFGAVSAACSSSAPKFRLKTFAVGPPVCALMYSAIDA